MKLADHLFMAEQTSKNRELLNEAKRAADLIESENNFGTMVYNAGKKMLVLNAQAAKIITDFNFPIVSSEDRQKDTKKFDDYEIELCKMVQALSDLRDSMPGIGMKNLPEDLEFLQKSVPTFKIDPSVMTYYYLLMHVFRTTADAFIHYGLMGFPYPNDDIQKNKEYYINLASSQLTQMNKGIPRHVLHACIEL